jgi:hypothetical protein
MKTFRVTSDDRHLQVILHGRVEKAFELMWNYYKPECEFYKILESNQENEAIQKAKQIHEDFLNFAKKIKDWTDKTSDIDWIKENTQVVYAKIIGEEIEKGVYEYSHGARFIEDWYFENYEKKVPVFDFPKPTLNPKHELSIHEKLEEFTCVIFPKPSNEWRWVRNTDILKHKEKHNIK